ncbi:MAG: tRNA (adenosine(37)-N6)-threonylcarbamoyltransferase complex dimerization subunit type 1 TsaB [Eubacteriales bacterium]|nr:tRNA (adenosine(37)-N6)-threonylcarbamoyltransferase complex dimerization subunit type 1 TsaB [Eubacteriales bacterium]
MRLLALDSAGLVASVALMEEENLLAEYTMNFKKTHSETLLPMIDAMVELTGVDLQDIDAIAVSAGPGSFTGLRIGSATAKGLGLALGKPLISVGTLEGMAYHFMESNLLICPMMDARRKQVYTGVYRFIDGVFTTVMEGSAMSVEDLMTYCNQLNETVLFLGDGVPVYKNMMEELLTVSHRYAPAHMNRQRASAVAARAFDLYKEGKIETAAEHAPVYFRKSQAERELEAKGEHLDADSVSRAH